MQVRRRPRPEHGDVVAADELAFGVQRLGDVAEEVDQERERLLAEGGRQVRRLRLRGVVGDGADDAAGGEAVAGEVYGAGGWGAVGCVDEAGKRVRFGVGRGSAGWQGGELRTGMGR